MIDDMRQRSKQIGIVVHFIVVILYVSLSFHRVHAQVSLDWGLLQ